MKILFLSHYFPPEVNAPASRTYEHCVRWVQAGHEVTVVTCAPNCPDGVLFDGYKNSLRRQVEDVQGIRVVRVWTHLSPNAGTIGRILNYVSYMISATLASLRLARPDVVVATSPQFFCGWAGVFVSFLKRAPFVLEIRDIWPESIRAVDAIRNPPLLRFLELLEKWMYRAADRIVTVGQGYREHIVSKIPNPEKVTVISNGVDVDRFMPQDADSGTLHRWGLEHKFVCSYVGTIGMAHGLEVVLHAARILKEKGREDIRFLLVGDGAARGSLESQSKAMQLDDMVVFTGRQPKEEIPFILASSDVCLVHLKKCELFESVIPSKVFETMAMCRPIIMGVNGEAREIVMRAGAGIAMEPDSPASLIEAVEALADQPDYKAQLSRAARDFVSEHYNRNTLANRYLELLGQVTGVDVGDSLAETPASSPESESVSALPLR